jgi:CO/xanthine dehydrogenase FAD-binding subunit
LRANPADYELAAPGSLQRVLTLYANEPGSWLPIAGGTDVMVLYAAGKLPARKLVNIGDLRELKRIEVTSSEVRIGAGCTYTDLRQHSVIAKEFSLLARAAAWTGGIANQNRGTLGGNIANASPAGDSLPVLLVYDADLILVSVRGERRIPYQTFHTGYKKTLLAPDELIHSICISRNLKGYMSYAKKVGARNAQAISKVVFAAMARISNAIVEDVRLAAGSVGPIPIRLTGTELALAGRAIDNRLLETAGKVMAEEIQPINDIRSTAEYRTAVLRNLLGEFLQGLPGARIAA